MTPWTAVCQASLSFTISQSLLKLMSIESKLMSIDAIQSSHPLSPSSFIFNLSQQIGKGSNLMSQLFTSGGQNIEASASASVLPINTLRCGMWDLVPCPETEPGLPALGAPMDWTTREVPGSWLDKRGQRRPLQ